MVTTFTLCDSNPVMICFQHVAVFQPADENTLITLASGKDVIVTESYDEVAEAANPEKQAGS